jgi:GSH-dependent disulfide-bond oxidoreductase
MYPAADGQTSKVELYGMGSPNVRKISIMLEEVGQPYVFHHVEVFRSGQFSPAFRGLNPNGKVPVLVDRSRGEPIVIFESAAILIYLAEKHGAFLARQEPARSHTLQWLMIQACNVGPLLGQLNHFLLAAPTASDYALERYRREGERLYRLLDQRLATQDNLAGAAYSIADIATYPWALYLERHGFAPEDYPHLAAWREKVGARPAVRRGMDAIRPAESADAEAYRTAAPADLDRFFGRA